MTSIDLIPPDTIARRDSRRRLRRWGFRLGFGTVLATTLHVALVELATGQHAELSQLTQRYTRLQEELERADGLLEKREELGRRREAISLIRGTRTAGHYLELLESTLTPESYLTTLVLERCPPFERDERDPTRQEACRARLRISGLAAEHAHVGRILREMIARDEFVKVGLVSVNELPPEPESRKKSRKKSRTKPKPPGVAFEILCVLAEEETGVNAVTDGPWKGAMR
jgi:hypothetical protein